MTSAGSRDLLTTLAQRTDPAHTAIVVVDMQNDFVSEGGAAHRRHGPPAAAQGIIPSIAALLEVARQVETLVVFAQMTHDFPDLRLSSDVDFLRRLQRYGDEPMLVKNTWGHEVVDGLKPAPRDLRVEKYRSSAFVGTTLDLILRTNHIRSLIVTGVVTQGCVLHTAMSATMHDYYVTVAKDCVASSSRELHEAALMVLASNLAHEDAVVSSARIIEEWGSRARVSPVAVS